MERLFRIEDILAYIQSQKQNNVSLTRLLSIYYEATQKNLDTNEQTLELWQGYIGLLEKNGYAHTEIREVYKMLKSKYWRFLSFWSGWLDYESRLPYSCSKRAKVVEAAADMLQYKECPEKSAILSWARERQVGSADSSDTRLLYPETPRSVGYTIEPSEFLGNEPLGMGGLGSCGRSLLDQENVGGNYPTQNAMSDTVTMCGSVFDSPLGAVNRGKPGSRVDLDMEIGGDLGGETNEGRLGGEKGPGSPNHKKITLNGRKLKILRTIGKGGSGKVYQVLSDKNEVFALKKIKIPAGRESEEIHSSYVNEIELLKRLKKRHEIVTLKDSYVNHDRIAILMEHGDIDLSRFLEIERTRVPGGYRCSQENYTMITLWEQMLRAVKCIHDHRIVHRDLKPANFLFVNGRLKLIDFGISKVIKNDTTNIIREKQIGTINYMSPEAIIEGKTKMGRSSDIWSLGCILYEMYFGESPFMRFKNLVQRMQKLLDDKYAVEYPLEEPNDNRYPEAVAEMQKCLVREPSKRAKIDDLLETGLTSRPRPQKDTHTFNKEELKAFISKIMDMKYTAPTEEAKTRIVEKISSLYLNN
ncbi:serine/threonine-protein kinase TTK/MPS1 [Nematocida homosporus]|uniref:serine/threonine-protein kinase TTK/MPS1 n=1 Tax=Nematocida homosporus TaxID=1912981 RepID=UPI00221E4759|nr:serine/threonine-protein kinase TTK/MPS1 [Nematocida homosporus]KAI5186490.1 serine/threonine-protein kinase TTK/MPS1 [Nematocida homosporus]